MDTCLNMKSTIMPPLQKRTAFLTFPDFSVLSPFAGIWRGSGVELVWGASSGQLLGRVLELTDEQDHAQILLQQLRQSPLPWQVSIKNYCPDGRIPSTSRPCHPSAHTHARTAHTHIRTHMLRPGLSSCRRESSNTLAALVLILLFWWIASWIFAFWSSNLGIFLKNELHKTCE